ncbi:probable E3 ubiquitin-protein ligase TRIML1 isoform X3 [Monodelphis domestica]|uniref:probable E3 ubiquitin-protein ligase TRIML1 isoform X3 n=1 Tax=Monodelphis domestica TaxID=13616 RepID=UPI0024E1CD2A|nr:probable E3 ubiquitin-protein ligase TRIML1 isoform X3 [Monodelphis domestica]
MAADKCKKKLEETLNVLHEKEEELKAEYNDMGKQEEYFKKDTDFYKKLIRCEYRKMHGIIYNEENRNLQNLDQGIEDKLAKVEVNKAKLSPQIQHDNEKILEVEESLGESPVKMLQDMKGILERNEELQLQDTETVNLTYTTYQMTGLKEILRSYQSITVDPADRQTSTYYT